VASGLDGRGKDLLKPFVAEEGLSAFLVGYEDEFHWPFGWGEVSRGLVRLSMRWYEAHVASRDLNEGRHVHITSNGSRVPRLVIPN